MTSDTMGRLICIENPIVKDRLVHKIVEKKEDEEFFIEVIESLSKAYEELKKTKFTIGI